MKEWLAKIRMIDLKLIERIRYREIFYFTCWMIMRRKRRWRDVIDCAVNGFLKLFRSNQIVMGVCREVLFKIL